MSDQNRGGQGGDGGVGETSTGARASEATGGSSSTDNDDGRDCDALADEEATELNVLIRNESDVTVFIGPREQTCREEPLFRIEGDDGDVVPHFRNPCEPSCEVLRGGYAGCPAACFFSPVIELAPGAQHTALYSGRVRSKRILPVECVDSEFGPTQDVECTQLTRLASGTYRVVVSATTELKCEQGFQSTCESCTSHDAGGCAYHGPLVFGDSTRVEAEFTVTEDGAVRSSDGDGKTIRVTFDD